MCDGDIGGVVIHNRQIGKEIDSIQAIAKSRARWKRVSQQGGFALADMRRGEQVAGGVIQSWSSWRGKGSPVGHLNRKCFPHWLDSSKGHMLLILSNQLGGRDEKLVVLRLALSAGSGKRGKDLCLALLEWTKKKSLPSQRLPLVEEGEQSNKHIYHRSGGLVLWRKAASEGMWHFSLWWCH